MHLDPKAIKVLRKILKDFSLDLLNSNLVIPEQKATLADLTEFITLWVEEQFPNIKKEEKR